MTVVLFNFVRAMYDEKCTSEFDGRHQFFVVL
jgi:hypothetical protein